mmetsp:Transcript_2839/g.6005  ORF Transcript_2839/g.6005 Transcript_2839/m.6005 type:complete len:206 (-) Transcript_2839:491-1108(-)
MGMSGSPNVRSFNSRTLSRMASSVPMVTMRNSVAEGSANRSSRSYIDTWNLSRADLALSPASSRLYLFFVALASSIFTAALEFTFRDTASTFSIRSARKEGVVSILNVWPVGAVSRTTRSNLPLRISWITLASATTSSVPAGSVSMISPSELRVEDSSELPPSLSFLPMSLSMESRNSFRAEVGSISIAFSDPSPAEPPSTGGTP